MKVFHILTLIIAFLFFVGLLSYTAIIEYLSSEPDKFPGDMTSCPDYWEIDVSGNCIIPLPGSSPNNVGELSKSQQRKYPLYKYYYNNYPTTLIGGNYLEKYNYNNLSKYGETLETSGGGVYRYNIGRDIPAGYDLQNPGVINFKDPQWAMKPLNKGFGDPYCGIGEWAKINRIEWDSINAYYNSRCKK
jgi:hypothetical protein